MSGLRRVRVGARASTVPLGLLGAAQVQTDALDFIVLLLQRCLKTESRVDLCRLPALLIQAQQQEQLREGPGTEQRLHNYDLNLLFDDKAL